MNAEAVNAAATWLTIAGAIPAFLFAVAYGVASPWYRSALGVVTFGLLGTLALLFVLILARRLFGLYPGYELAAVAVYGMLAVALWGLFIVYLRERRSPSFPPPLFSDVPPTEKEVTK